MQFVPRQSNGLVHRCYCEAGAAVFVASIIFKRPQWRYSNAIHYSSSQTSVHLSFSQVFTTDISLQRHHVVQSCEPADVSFCSGSMTESESRD